MVRWGRAAGAGRHHQWWPHGFPAPSQEGWYGHCRCKHPIPKVIFFGNAVECQRCFHPVRDDDR